MNFEQLPDDAPIFLSANGTPLTYHAWYYHWNRAIKSNELSLNPHKADTGSLLLDYERFITLQKMKQKFINVKMS